MNVTEIVLLIIGVVVFVVSFILPEKKSEVDKEAIKILDQNAKELMENQIKAHENDVTLLVEEKTAHALDKTERTLERISNEKIMAVMEYSDTVISQIKSNHDEVVFLYDMLHNKETAIKKTVSDLNTSISNAKEESIEISKKQESLMDEMLTEVLIENNEQDALIENADEVYTQEIEEADDLFFLGFEEENKNNNELILQHFKEGKTNIEIAQCLGLGVGEVKLVIDLFQDGSK